MSKALHRPNLSQEIAAALRQRVVAGQIEPGVRINEVHLAAELGISRTPLREALMSLVAEGSIQIEPRRGFFARGLTAREFEQLAAMRAILDPAALRLAGLPSSDQIRRLRSLNRQLEEARGPERIIALDDAWHLALLAHCGNEVLLGEIRTFMARTHRYELVLMREEAGTRRLTKEHREIMAAIRAGDLGKACRALERNVRAGSPIVLAWLERRTGR